MDAVMVLAVKAIIRFGGKYLIVKRGATDAFGAGIWEFPGGKVAFGESLEDALAREVREETGLDVTVNKLLYATSFFTNPQRQVFLLAYECAAFSGDVNLSFEHSQFLWAPKDRLREKLDAAILRDMDKHRVFEALT